MIDVLIDAGPTLPSSPSRPLAAIVEAFVARLTSLDVTAETTGWE